MTLQPPPPPPMPVIEATKLARWYGSIIALTNLDVKVPPGITGLLGPNGAGKSTFLRLVTGQMRPSDGQIRVFGQDPVTQPGLFRKVGFCSEHDALFEDLTPRQMLRFLGRCSGYGPTEARERAELGLETAGIADVGNRACRGFSKGMRQRVRIAAALLHQPSLLLLDEPMTGLDPLGRKAVVDLVQKLGQEGVSVLFSSHILHEVEAVSQHVLVFVRGMCLAEGTMRHIREQLQDYEFTLHVRADAPRRLGRSLLELEHVTAIHFHDVDRMTVSSSSAHRLSRELPKVALAEGVRIHEVDCPGESLEALFQRLIKR